MSLDKKTCFPPLNNSNYMEWSIHMEAELVHKGLWDNIQCKVSVEGKATQNAEEIVTKWCGKCKKMVETCAKIILRVEDCSWPIFVVTIQRFSGEIYCRFTVHEG